jgi:sugar lactone lactonase YvrE
MGIKEDGVNFLLLADLELLVSFVYFRTSNQTPTGKVTGNRPVGICAACLHQGHVTLTSMIKIANMKKIKVTFLMLFFAGVAAAGIIGSGSGGTMVTDDAGNVYAIDRAHDRVVKWAPGAATGVTAAGGHGYGAAPNQLANPAALFVTHDGVIYVADAGNQRVQKWTANAAEGITVAGGNGAGGKPNQLNYPSGIYVDNEGNVYVADRYNNRIQEWAPGAVAGITVAGGHGQGSAANQLNLPDGVYVDVSHFIYVTDVMNQRLQRWAPGAAEGMTMSGGGLMKAQPNTVTDKDGNTYELDTVTFTLRKIAGKN